MLVLGAGAVRATATSQAPAGRQPPLDRDFFRIAASVPSAAVPRLRRFLRSVLGTYDDILLKSLESTATYLYLKALEGATGSPEHLTFLQLLEMIERVLAATTNDLRLGPRSRLYRFYLRELNRVQDSNELCTITFNYDLTIERVLDELQARGHAGVFAYPGCYRLPGILRVYPVQNGTPFVQADFRPIGTELLKLHGSLTWHSRHTSTRPTPRALFNAGRLLYVANEQQIVPNMSWQRGRRLYLKPIIVPPMSGKRGVLHSCLEPLWRAAGERLRAADRVVILGYSCPPLDLEAHTLLAENMRSQPDKELVLVDPDTALAGRFTRLCGASRIEVFSSLDAYLSA